MVLGYMFRPHCGHLQANLYRLSALNVRTIWDPIVCTIMTCEIKNHCQKRILESKQFHYLGTTLTNQNSIREEIKSRLKSGNACYHSPQNLLLSKNLKIKIYRIIILPVVLYGCETWSLTLREERRLKVSENSVLRIFEPKSEEVRGEWIKLHNDELNGLYCLLNIVRM